MSVWEVSVHTEKAHKHTQGLILERQRARGSPQVETRDVWKNNKLLEGRSGIPQRQDDGMTQKMNFASKDR